MLTSPLSSSSINIFSCGRPNCRGATCPFCGSRPSPRPRSVGPTGPLTLPGDSTRLGPGGSTRSDGPSSMRRGGFACPGGLRSLSLSSSVSMRSVSSTSSGSTCSGPGGSMRPGGSAGVQFQQARVLIHGLHAREAVRALAVSCSAASSCGQIPVMAPRAQAARFSSSQRAPAQGAAPQDSGTRE